MKQQRQKAQKIHILNYIINFFEPMETKILCDTLDTNLDVIVHMHKIVSSCFWCGSFPKWLIMDIQEYQMREDFSAYMSIVNIRSRLPTSYMYLVNEKWHHCFESYIECSVSI